ncbi:menaquinol-cytochrome c reductase cytochrome b/c subunit [Bhargavaea beijingensis]|uniref:C-type cytochrome n=1 Tax=Bhargavaea beijingensis TaxID=426756 RepID=A0A1G7AK56_9BACL|nr:menaquinol-cytochrome c reductase cytochrome b/c subunit [Bhargavaea beijingensis]MCW1928174.1 c-type cytochrome [Bhargavaea beijingensis]RSK24852.1 c-type cytochrome [Bhargavaea beijingensis]SDE15288.1 menaquinol-cytochrome c reductase cytochrome b/c subunit [Bhargavaea beijingensis]
MHRGKGMKFVGDSRIRSYEKNRIPKDYSEYPGKTEAFWPNFLLKEWIIGAIFLVGYLILTVAHPSPLERQADPTDTGYIPLPDWYFLQMYQLLKYEFASGPYNIVGAIIIPGLAIGALLLMPFLDTSKERRPFKRPLPTAFMLLTLFAMIYLTWESVVNHDWDAAKAQGEIVEEAEFDTSDPGYEIYMGQSCVTCHGENFEGTPAGVPLTGTGHTPEEVADIAVNGIVKDGQQVMPADAFEGSEEELQQLAEFLSTVTQQ